MTEKSGHRKGDVFISGERDTTAWEARAKHSL